VVLRDFVWIKRLHFWLISDAVSKLTDAGENSSTVCLVFPVLLAHSELNCEPVDGSQALKLNLARTERGKTNLLGEISELLVCEHGCMAHELVNDIRLWSIERLLVMSNVLGRVEHFEG